MTALTVAPKTLTAELKPICAAIRKQTTPTQRRDLPLAGAVRLQAKDFPQRSWSVAYLFDEEHHLGKFPNPSAALDVLLDLDAAHALATILDAKKPATLTVEPWNEVYNVNERGFPHTIKCTGQTLIVTQPSACPGRTDVMRFKVLEV